MENVTDALIMASAALLFVIAFSITMFLYTRAKETSDTMFEHINMQEYLPRVGSVKNNVTREVGIETVIPTLYRYAQGDENIQIRICDNKGDELQIFDRYIESQMNNNTTEESRELNKKYNDQNFRPYLFTAPWSNQETSYYLERINAYVYSEAMVSYPYVDYRPGRSHEGLKNYFNNRFEESYVEYRLSGDVYVDEYGEEINKTQPSKKTIITYKIK